MAAYRFAVAWGLVLSAVGCADAGRALSTGLEDVRATAPERAAGDLGSALLLPVSPGPLGAVVPPAPELLYAEPVREPARHLVRTTLSPIGATTLRDVQAAEVEVEVSGGAVGAREVSVLFVSPQGLAWERQARRVDIAPAATATVRFSLPISNTLVEDQALSGRWSVTTLDEGVELAATSFEVAP